jgi:RNA polymerase sigma-70 factor (ECF subfamily)
MAEIEDVRTVEADVVEAATRRELRSLLDQLTPAQRDVVLLRVFGGLKIEEVARALGRRTGAVKALQRRAFETLKVLLEQREYPSGVDGR